MNEQELRVGCTHQRVVSRPIGSNSTGWTDRWVCDVCGKGFVPEAHLRCLTCGGDGKTAQAEPQTCPGCAGTGFEITEARLPEPHKNSQSKQK